MVRSTRPPVFRGALAGLVAAGLWAAVEPFAARVLRHAYTDRRLLGRLVTRGRGSSLLGLGLHLINGAAFGAAFTALGGRGWRQGLAAAQLENLALWPAFVWIDAIHPDVRAGIFPRLLTSSRVFAQEVFVHTVFGITLGELVRRSDLLPRSRRLPPLR